MQRFYQAGWSIYIESKTHARPWIMDITGANGAVLCYASQESNSIAGTNIYKIKNSNELCCINSISLHRSYPPTTGCCKRTESALLALSWKVWLPRTRWSKSTHSLEQTVEHNVLEKFCLSGDFCFGHLIRSGVGVTALQQGLGDVR